MGRYMTFELTDADRAWLREFQRRIGEGSPINVNEMMVALRGDLPRSFRPTQLSSFAFGGYRPSVLGLQAIGDSLGCSLTWSVPSNASRLS